MQSLFYLLIQILDLYWWIVIINVIISWLIGFNVLNTQNRFVFMIFYFTNRLTNPILNRIRNFLPNFGLFIKWNHFSRFIDFVLERSIIKYVDKNTTRLCVIFTF